MRKATFWIFFLVCLPSSAAIDGNVFAVKLRRLTDALGADFMQTFYDSIGSEESHVDGRSFINRMSQNIGNKFVEMENILKSLRTVIENYYPSFTATNQMAECCNVGSLEYDSSFRAKINRDKGCVTISADSPSNIKFPTTNIVDEMKKNQAKIPDLRWQYFAGEDGILLNYPETGFSSCRSYDPRFRPFYVSTATPLPKDVVIVMDTSDSMQSTLKGKVKLQIAKEAAITVITTLNPNDRVGFVNFNTRAETPGSCFSQTLAMVTSRNVDELKRYINGRPAAGDTNYEEAFTTAFLYFNQSERSLKGEYRDKVILFLTDGDYNLGRNPLDVIKELNEPLNNSVIIHTFGLSNAFSEEMLRNISNQVRNSKTYGEIRRGRFERILEPDRLRTIMASYYQYFAYTRSTSPVFTPPYLDIFSDIGIVLSLCLPVNSGGMFVGVVCTDIELSDLLTDIKYLSESETSYVFMIDSYNRTLIHPLLPIYQNLLPDVTDINYLEHSAAAAEVIKSMQTRIGGNKTLLTKMVQPRGEMIREGDQVRDIEAHYFWTAVPNSDYSICFVISVNEKQTNLPTLLPGKEKFMYHNRILRPGDHTDCVHYTRFATADQSGVMLTPRAFVKPYVYIDETETESQIVSYENYIWGETSYNPGLKSSVINSVSATFQIEKLWKENKEKAPYLVWRYIASSDGVMRMYPGIQLAKDYDFTVRPWYTRTVGHKGLYVVTMPYVDFWGSGLIISITKAIYQGRTNGQHTTEDAAISVVGTDVPLYYFNQMMINSYMECNNTKLYSCIMIDSTGFLVMHPDFVERADDPNLESPIHITTKEGSIAEDLMDEGIMYKQKCTDVSNLKKQTTYRISVPVGGIDKTATKGYELRPIPGTTIYLILKNNHHRGTCCSSSTAPDGKECNGNACYCLCYDRIPFNQCTNRITESGKSSETCSPRPPALLYSEPNDTNRIANLKQCFKRNCSCRKTRDECYSIAGCSWCTENHDGSTLNSESFCDVQSVCPFRKCTATAECFSKCPDKTTTDGQTSGTSTGVIVAIVVIVIVILIVIVVVVIIWQKRSSSSENDKNDPYYLTPAETGDRNNFTPHISGQASDGYVHPIIVTVRQGSVSSNIDRSRQPLPNEDIPVRFTSHDGPDGTLHYDTIDDSVHM